MVFKPAYLEINPHAIEPKDPLKGLDLSDVCGWIERLKGDPKYSGQFCKESSSLSTSSHSKLELTLDEIAADDGKVKTANEWIFRYWNKINNGRVMASLGDLYANFKLIKQMHEQGTAAEQKKAQLYLNSLREDFKFGGADGGLTCSTRVFYGSLGLDARVVQHYGCNNPGLVKEMTLKVPEYKKNEIKTVDKLCLRALFDTADEPETIRQTLEFISRRSKIYGWSALNNSRRATYPKRAVLLLAFADEFHFNCAIMPSTHRSRSRGVRVK